MGITNVTTQERASGLAKMALGDRATPTWRERDKALGEL
jgi:hypothetical protein